ncbi:MAG: sugar phosphate nucleotidyltransferase [Candidatus Gastranaerophilales bacterium]|nr:sugar phosphate nucleotidyltransferase [Candidatus Gastranaerophilales bacterium]
MINNNTRAIILAAGKGTRMKSDLPKVLHPIFDKPLLGYVLDAVNNTKIVDENYVIVGHKAELVEKYVNDNYTNAKCILQMPQLGTGDAVHKAYNDLKDFSGEVIILCGDAPLITPETITDFIETHRKKHASLTVMSALFDNPTNYGRIVRNQSGGLQAIVEEKDATPEQKNIKEINAGIYCLDWKTISAAFQTLQCNNAQGEYYLTDIVQWAVTHGLKSQSYVLKNNEEIFGINSKTHLAEATKILNKRIINKHLENGVTIVDPDSTFISPDTTIGADTTILPNVYISGTNTIGSNCKIGPFSHLRGGAVIGDFVKIGNFVEIKKSTIKDHTNVCHLSYVGDSEIGSGVNIGAGTITANYNPINKIKSKTIIKDGANTGSNTVVVAPVTIHENASIGAGSIITKDIEAGALAITRAPLRVIQNWVKSKLAKIIH